MRPSVFFRALTALGLLIGLLAVAPVTLGLAACEGEGTTSVDCTAAGSPYTEVVDGSAGNDTITVETGAVVGVANGPAIDTHGGSDRVTIEAGASVESSDNTTDHIGIYSSSGTNNVDNAGSIAVSGNAFNTGILTLGDSNIINSGSIEAAGDGATTWNTGIGNNHGTMVVDNSGVIIASGSPNNNLGVSMYEGDGAMISNSGTIAAAGDGQYNVAVNVSLHGDSTLTVNNSGLISASGDSLNNTGISGDDHGGQSSTTTYTLYNSGVIAATGSGNSNTSVVFNGPSDSSAGVTNAGVILAAGSDYDYAIVTGRGDDTVILADGSLTSGDVAVATTYGDDTVVVGMAGVSYSQQCGNIETVQVSGGATVEGMIDGGDDSDTIVFGIATANGNTVANLDAYIASLGGSNTVIIGDQSYSYSNFESYRINAVVYHEGATRLYDDGIVLAFAQAGGIAVCSGEAGLRAGMIDFAALETGKRTFALNGWTVQVAALGDGRYEVHLLDASGQEHFNDANGDGSADSRFLFTH